MNWAVFDLISVLTKQPGSLFYKKPGLLIDIKIRKFWLNLKFRRRLTLPSLRCKEGRNSIKKNTSLRGTKQSLNCTE